jgi:tetratricopeptide (TPR) repeat protein
MVMLESNEPPQISMMCRANKETSVKVFFDEPLVLSVTIFNDSAVAADSYNAPFRDQIRELEKKFREKRMEEEEFKEAVDEIEQNMLKVRIYRFGGPEGWPHFIRFQALSEKTWRDVDWPLKLSIYSPVNQVVDLDASTSCYVEYGLDPEDPERPTGKYQIKAVVEIVKDKIVESNVVTLNLQQKTMPKTQSSKEENLLNRAKYAFRRGLYKEAEEYVQSVLKANPNSISALHLLGKIEEKKSNLSAALSAYEKALEKVTIQLPDRKEPPHLIIENIKRLRALMEE